MKIDKAIGVLNNLNSWSVNHFSYEEIKAVSLGFEALKCVDKCRKTGHLPPGALLPGETKD